MPGQRFHEWLRCRAGLAATEFAFIAPVMILLFFGVVEGSAALSADRKVVLSANTLADLVAQETSITAGQLDDLFVGMEGVAGAKNGEADFRVVSLYYDPDTDEVKVGWSYDSSGTEPYARDSVYAGGADVSLLDDASSIIVGETAFAYSAPYAKTAFGSMTMNKLALRWPRRAAQVQFCDSAGACTN